MLELEEGAVDGICRVCRRTGGTGCCISAGSNLGNNEYWDGVVGSDLLVEKSLYGFGAIVLHVFACEDRVDEIGRSSRPKSKAAIAWSLAIPEEVDEGNAGLGKGER